MQINEKKHDGIFLGKTKELLLCFFLVISNFSYSQIYIQNDSLLHISGGATVIINGKKFDNKKTKEADSTKIYIVEGTVVYNWDNDKIQLLTASKDKNETVLLSKKKEAQQKLQEKDDSIDTRQLNKVKDGIDEPYNGVLFTNTLNITYQGYVTTQSYGSMLINNYLAPVPEMFYVINKTPGYYNLSHTGSFSEVYTTRPPPFSI